MKAFTILVCALLALWAVPLRAAESLPEAEIPAEVLERMRVADVVILGEVHDNPRHHAVQLAAIRALRPKAVVWEMISPETAARINAGWLEGEGRLEQAVAAARKGWPNFDMYVPLLEATQGLPIYGGLLPRAAAPVLRKQGMAVVFGSAAAEYGLMVPLPEDELAARLDEQDEAHCHALPQDQLKMMVDFQRLRDAVLARAAVRAVEETGGPVVVITGNGHARTDRGVPEVLRRVRPRLRVFSLGQSEGDRIRGRFDAVLDSPPAERPDPCAVFENKG